MLTRNEHLARVILAARQSVCLAEMIASGKHLYCGRAYVPARELLPNLANKRRDKTTI